MPHSILTTAFKMLLVAIVAPSLSPAAAQTAATQLISQSPPAPPSDPPPNGTQPGGGLDPTARTPCTRTNERVRALIPVKNPVLTATDRPTILVYIPFRADQVQRGEFSLLPYPKEQQRLYSVRFTLPKTPGVVSVTIPSETGLKPGESYHWYFQLYCADGNGKQPDLTVHGFLQRVPLTNERERQIRAATPDVWYDAIARVAIGLQASPQDANLRNQWKTLLRTIGAEDFAQQPILGPIVPLK